MSLTLFLDPVFEDHQTGRHPESPARLEAIRKRLTDERIAKLGKRGTIRRATLEEVTRIHGRDYVNQLEKLANMGGGRVDADTVMSAASFEVAMKAAGTAIAAVDAVMKGDSKRALCLFRPPGHHALADEAMGFCLLNNVAIAAAHARTVHHLDRVLIVDFDIHHGNGTQDLFYSDGQVVFFSSQRFPFWPGSGAKDETGAGAGLGATFNLPVKYGTAPVDYRKAFEATLMQAVRRAKPQILLVSAGFDAHREDPIGDLGLGNEDFEFLTKLVRDVADRECGGRLVSVLEGGYNVDRLAECVDLHAEGLSRA
ncbi:acetoin utilization protein [Planctomyces sp. SCGC AG-212-M04]|nr:acetoin utilization protein [Planctomyces sp. SCGC AG-212-M04]